MRIDCDSNRNDVSEVIEALRNQTEHRESFFYLRYLASLTHPKCKGLSKGRTTPTLLDL